MIISQTTNAKERLKISFNRVNTSILMKKCLMMKISVKRLVILIEITKHRFSINIKINPILNINSRNFKHLTTSKRTLRKMTMKFILKASTFYQENKFIE